MLSRCRMHTRSFPVAPSVSGAHPHPPRRSPWLMRWLAAPIRCALRALAARGRRRRWLDQERDRQCALALSMRFGVVVERVAKHSPDVTRGHLLVWPQRGLPRESDPFAANHHVRSWADALARVKVYGALQPLVRRGGGAVAPRYAPVVPAAPVVDGASIAVPSRPSASAAGLGSLGSACAGDLVDRHGLAGAQRCRALALLAHGFADFAARRRIGWEAARLPAPCSPHSTAPARSRAKSTAAPCWRTSRMRRSPFTPRGQSFRCRPDAPLRAAYYWRAYTTLICLVAASPRSHDCAPFPSPALKNLVARRPCCW